MRAITMVLLICWSKQLLLIRISEKLRKARRITVLIMIVLSQMKSWPTMIKVPIITGGLYTIQITRLQVLHKVSIKIVYQLMSIVCLYNQIWKVRLRGWHNRNWIINQRWPMLRIIMKVVPSFQAISRMYL